MLKHSQNFSQEKNFAKSHFESGRIIPPRPWGLGFLGLSRRLLPDKSPVPKFQEIKPVQVGSQQGSHGHQEEAPILVNDPEKKLGHHETHEEPEKKAEKIIH